MKDVYEGDPEPLALVVLIMAPQRYNISDEGLSHGHDYIAAV